MRVMATGVLALLLGGPVLAQTLDGGALVRADERMWQEEHARWRQENRDVADRLEAAVESERLSEEGERAARGGGARP
jgi:hypothetical protein